MPDEISELRDLLETAMSNLAAAEDEAEQAAADLDLARSAENRASQLAEEADKAEQEARRRYVDALKRHGYVRTADGPVPAALTEHDPAGCGCGAHQGGPGNVAPLRAMSTDPRTGAKVITAEDVRAQRPHYQPEQPEHRYHGTAMHCPIPGCVL